MNFLGKLIGLFFGYLVMGPVGAVLGFIIGGAFDRGLRIHLHNIPREHPAEVESAFFMATFSVMGHLAKVDGHVSEDEIRAAESVMKRLELNEESRKEAMRLFRLGKEANFDLQATLHQLYRQCARHPELLRFFIEIQLEAALSDGALQDAEQNLLLYMCEMLHISPREFEQLWARQWASQAFHGWYSQFQEEARYQERTDYSSRESSRSSHARGSSHGSSTWSSHEYSQNYQSQNQRARHRQTFSLKDAYGVLGVSENASPAEIKKAYRVLMNQHHPDKLASRGLPESMMKLAKEKTIQIRAAYDLLREEKGFR